jgi:crotonobetainyl-CoA:carnitine CoA-transferase CaiB-like acyl-CoA transferase
MPGPLSHIRVLDLSRVLAGPWAAQNLADLGAEVIKIERPGAGDDTRGWGPPWLKDGAGKDSSESAYFQAVNRNKKSVTLDISRPEGQKIARELAMKSQVLIENYKVGTLKRYGLDFDSLKKDNPGLIYCSVTGFGQDGPYAPRPGYDFIFQGMGGLMSITG